MIVENAMGLDAQERQRKKQGRKFSESAKHEGTLRLRNHLVKGGPGAEPIPDSYADGVGQSVECLHAAHASHALQDLDKPTHKDEAYGMPKTQSFGFVKLRKVEHQPAISHHVLELVRLLELHDFWRIIDKAEV